MADLVAEIKRRAREREARALDRGASSKTLIRSKSSQSGPNLFHNCRNVSQPGYMHESFQSRLMPTFLEPQVLRQFKGRCTVSIRSLQRYLLV